jgi:hypothetical protein
MLDAESLNDLVGIPNLDRKGHFINRIASFDLFQKPFWDSGVCCCLIKVPVDAFEKA